MVERKLNKHRRSDLNKLRIHLQSLVCDSRYLRRGRRDDIVLTGGAYASTRNWFKHIGLLTQAVPIGMPVVVRSTTLTIVL
jgi:hypothetical protein